jgi:hypothetical protein
MLHDSGLPKCLWAEAFSTATYVHNRTPTKALDGLTPFEALYGASLTSGTCAHSARRPLLSSQARSCTSLMIGRPCAILLGISTAVVATRFGTRKGKVVVESRDVTFFKDGLPPPALCQSVTTTNDDDEPLTQQPHDMPADPTPSAALKAPALLPAHASTAPPVPRTGLTASTTNSRSTAGTVCGPSRTRQQPGSPTDLRPRTPRTVSPTTTTRH